MRTILYTGKGGVGKTSVAAATALEAAREGATVVLAARREEIGAALAALRGELESDAPDSGVVTDLMRRLADMTLGVAADQPEGNLRSRLEELGHLLQAGAAEGP